MDGQRAHFSAANVMGEFSAVRRNVSCPWMNEEQYFQAVVALD